MWRKLDTWKTENLYFCLYDPKYATNSFDTKKSSVLKGEFYESTHTDIVSMKRPSLWDKRRLFANQLSVQANVAQSGQTSDPERTTMK